MNLIEEGDASGALLTEYTYTDGVDWLVRAVVSGVTYYVHQDILGNVVALTDASGQLVEQYTYDAFGKPTVKDASFVTLTTSKIPFLFTGRQYDWETDLYQYRARDYNPDLGRFHQPDPISFAGGDPNLYRYCANNPVNYCDPSGLDILDDALRAVSSAISNVDSALRDRYFALAEYYKACTAAEKEKALELLRQAEGALQLAQARLRDALAALGPAVAAYNRLGWLRGLGRAGSVGAAGAVGAAAGLGVRGLQGPFTSSGGTIGSDLDNAFYSAFYGNR